VTRPADRAQRASTAAEVDTPIAGEIDESRLGAEQRGTSPRTRDVPKVIAHKELVVIILGLILLVLGFVLNIPILWTLGIILLVVGAVLWLMGSSGRLVGGRRHYW
jgi:hypothetical protein